MTPIMEIKMNLKRAFLIAAATLLIPGFAMAQSTVTFETTINYVPGIDENTPEGLLPPPAIATRICNNGNPLDETYDELGPMTSDKVTFVVENFTDVSGNFCEIFIDDVAGWTVLAATNNGITNAERATCKYVATDDFVPQSGEGQAILPENTCEFVMAPPLAVYNVTKEWEFNDASSDDVNTTSLVDVICYNTIWYNSSNGNVTLRDWETEFPVLIDDDETLTFPVQDPNRTYHVNPFPETLDDATYCMANETVLDSAVETDNQCDGDLLSVVNPSADCTITNSVFFEGIPTLSQYGMAIMALLMLGMGFVGFRRFV